MVGRWRQLRFHRVSSRRENRPGFRAGEPPERAQRVSKRRENRPGFLTRLRLRPTRHVLESKKEAPVDRGLLEQPRV